MFPHRRRPLCDHPLRGPLSEIHHQEGHPETRVQDQRCLLQEEAQEANHCGGKMSSCCKSEVYLSSGNHVHYILSVIILFFLFFT